MVLVAQKRTKRELLCQRLPEKFISSGEQSMKLVLKEVNDYHLWFKRCH